MLPTKSSRKSTSGVRPNKGKLLIGAVKLGFTAIDMARGRVENTHLAGGVPEWPKGTDCKSVGTAFGGSNPPPSTIIYTGCGPYK